MRLSVQIEFDKTLDLDTKKDSVVVGRSNQCDLIISHEGISRQHCLIEKSGDKYFITDLGSSNGVFINGRKLAPNKKYPYRQDQQLSIGGLECAISEISQDTEGSANKIVSSQTSGDFTSTIRMARIELNKPSITLELEKKRAPRGPKNPISAKKEIETKQVNSKRYLPIIIGILILLLVWLLTER